MSPLVSITEELALYTSVQHSKVDYFCHLWEYSQTTATQRLLWYRRNLLDPVYPSFTQRRCENLLWRIQHLLLFPQSPAVSEGWRNRFEKWNTPLIGPLCWSLETNKPFLPPREGRRGSEGRGSEGLKPALKSGWVMVGGGGGGGLGGVLTEHVYRHRLGLAYLDLQGTLSQRQLNGDEDDPWASYFPLTPPSLLLLPPPKSELKRKNCRFSEDLIEFSSVVSSVPMIERFAKNEYFCHDQDYLESDDDEEGIISRVTKQLLTKLGGLPWNYYSTTTPTPTAATLPPFLQLPPATSSHFNNSPNAIVKSAWWEEISEFLLWTADLSDFVPPCP